MTAFIHYHPTDRPKLEPLEGLSKGQHCLTFGKFTEGQLVLYLSLASLWELYSSIGGYLHKQQNELLAQADTDEKRENDWREDFFDPLNRAVEGME